MAKKENVVESVEAPSNMGLVAQALAALEAVVPPASTEAANAIKAESDKLGKAREALAAAGLSTAEVDAKLEALASDAEQADSGRAELVAAIASLERFAKILGHRCSGARVESIREKYAEILAAGVPEFPGPCEMKKLANGKLRAVHGGRATQIVTALLNMSENGRKRVNIEQLAEALLDVDSTFGDIEGCAQQCRTVLQNFADVWTSDSSFVFSPN